MSAATDVWAVVLNWNGANDTLRCVASLRAQDLEGLRILVVDNGSTDGSFETLRLALSNDELLSLSDNLGFAGGMNRGIEKALAAGAEFVVLVNNDATLAPQALRQLLEAVQHRPEVALAVPTIFSSNDPSSVWYAGGTLSRWTGTARHGKVPAPEPIEVSFGTGCCLLIRTQHLKTVGFLNETYFLYFEDVEYCDRVLQAGLRILYVPHAHAWHAGGGSTASQHQKAPALDYYDVRNGLWFIRERLRGAARLSALAYFVVVRLPRKLLRIFFRSASRSKSYHAVWKGLVDGLKSVDGYKS